MTSAILTRYTRTSRLNVTPAMTVYVVLLLAVPARLVFAPLGAAGTPAQMLGVCLFVWWVAQRLGQLRPERRQVQPVRRALLLFALTILASYVAAATRAIDGEEMRAADRSLLSLCAWAGIVLVVSDGVKRSHLDRLLLMLSRAGGVLAGLGVLQFFTGLDVVRYIWIPGLTSNADYSTLLARAAFRRPAGTATHPIEFGVLLAMILPIALHYALDAADRTWKRWIPVCLIALALPISISRSAVLGAVLVLVFMLPSWARRRRRRAYGVILVFLGLIYVAVPGLLGTLRNLFTGLFSDSSTTSRTDSYSVAAQYIDARPIFGRGVGTFLPSLHIVDNQYLLMLIGGGVLGLAALLLLFLTGILSARGVRRRSSDPATRGLAQALATSVAVAAVASATFDLLSFPMVAGTTFLVLGSVSAIWRLYVAPANPDRPAADAEPSPAVSSLPRRGSWSGRRAAPGEASRPGTGSASRSR